ncbi:MAG TPA: DUF4058 family protein [Planctomycetaceae bacterium]
MPIHDWTRVAAGTFHDFHSSWITHIKERLNAGLLPPDYYALAEQRAGDVGPDVLTLEAAAGPEETERGRNNVGGVAVAESPPRVRITETLKDIEHFLGRQKRLVIRHSSGDRIVAFVEIVSPGNKRGRAALETFVEKAAEALEHGHHLLVIDLFPPGAFDPTGIHGAIGRRVEGESHRYDPPPDKPLTLAAYSAGAFKTAYVEPTAVGDRLIDMPLFLDPGHYVPVPLEETYMAAWRGVPQRWRRVIEEAG